MKARWYYGTIIMRQTISPCAGAKGEMVELLMAVV
jgi:hypothetical protein